MKLIIGLLLFPVLLFAKQEDSLFKNKKMYRFEEFESLRLDISAGQSYFLIQNNKNESKEIKSTKMIDFDLKYIYHSSLGHRTYLGIEFLDLSYKDTPKSVNSDMTFLKIGHIYSLYSRMSIFGEAFSFNYLKSDSLFSLSKDNALGFKLGLKNDIYHKYSTRIGLEGSFSILSNAGYMYDYGIYWRKVYRTFSVEVNVSGQKNTLQNNEEVKSTLTNGLIGTKISIPID